MALPPPVFGPPTVLAQPERLEPLRPLVRAVVARVLRLPLSNADVEDGTNETFRRAIEGRQRLRPGEPLAPWVLGIARHVALDAGRARGRAQRRAAPTGDDDASPLDRVADSSPGVDEQIERAQVKARVRAALATLNDDQRRALEMFHLQGMAYKEIAAHMSVPIGTVCTWVSRGRRALSQALDEGDRR
jgi:RNA polymerase sigma-70 factor (ECF subfamily)